MGSRDAGGILVGFESNIELGEVEEIVSGFGLSVTERKAGVNTYLVEVPLGSEREWIRKFKELSSVKFSESDQILALPERFAPPYDF